ncbi:MAG: DASS family sodium-coupled anion symporter [Gemmatimonadota bacterium]|nr:DASS family sodium-coupled anion symporter [Gemmatimonadota bacterium]
MADRDRSASGFERATGPRARIGLVAGPLLFAGMLALGTPAGLEPDAWRSAAVGALMATWWITEPIPLPATALLPIALFPLLGVGDPAEAAAPYAHPLIFLFLGGFLLALAMERWELHRRIALAILGRTGTRPRGIVAGFMATAGLLSMGISNTATTLMLLPIGISVLRLTEGRKTGSFGAALMLGLAFGASVGGVATLIGTPPNALTAAFLEEAYGVRIGFARWLLIGLPLVAVALPATWLLLTRVAFRLPPGRIPGVGRLIEAERDELGPMSPAERRVSIVFAITAAAWVTRPLLERAIPGLSDAGIAILAGIALFLVPAREGDRLLNWRWARRLPWGVLILFGGGLSLASAVDRTGLAAWLAESTGGLAGSPYIAVVLAVVVATILFSELASNTASAATFLPVVGAVAVTMGVDPLLLVIPAGLAASGGYMLPVATPPNAIVYGSGAVTVPQLVRAGGLLDLLFAVLVPLAAVLLVAPLFGG